MVCLNMISTYLTVLVPVVNKMQPVITNLYTEHQHITTNLLSNHRIHTIQADTQFQNHKKNSQLF